MHTEPFTYRIFLGASIWSYIIINTVLLFSSFFLEFRGTITHSLPVGEP